MKWHGAWLYGVQRTCAETAAVSCGTSHAGAVSTPLQWVFKTALSKASHSCRIACKCSESAWEQRIALYKKHSSSEQRATHNSKARWLRKSLSFSDTRRCCSNMRYSSSIWFIPSETARSPCADKLYWQYAVLFAINACCVCI